VEQQAVRMQNRCKRGLKDGNSTNSRNDEHKGSGAGIRTMAVVEEPVSLRASFPPLPLGLFGLHGSGVALNNISSSNLGFMW
jgi:hypothetical protein